MKAYLVTTTILFALLTAVHLWRVIQEIDSLGRDPWFLIITLFAGALCGWGISLLRRPSAA